MVNHAGAIIVRVVLVVLCLCQLACVSNRFPFESENNLVRSLKRVSIKKMTAVKDQRKPLAAMEEGGWVASKGVLFGTVNHEWVGAFRSDSLQPTWWLKNDKGLTTAPLVIDSRVFFAFRTGKLVSVDRLSGQPYWSLTLDAFIDQAMIVNQDRLFAIAASRVLYCLDIKTGKILWSFDFSSQDLVSIRSIAYPLIIENKLILGTHDGAISCLNIADGKLLWQLEPELVAKQHLFKNVVGELSIYKNQLIVTRYDGWIGAIKLKNDQLEAKPSIEWVFKQKLGLITCSKIHGGTLFVGTVKGHVVAVDLESKLVKWRYRLSESIQSLLVGEKQLYAMSSQGTILLFDRVEGRLLWSDRLDAAISGKPMLLDNYMVFATGMNNLYYYQVVH